MNIAKRSQPFPAFTDDVESKRLALRVRKVYKTVLRIIESTKNKKVRNVSLLCSQLVNIPTLQMLPQTRLFADLVRVHVASGKFRKNSYKTFLRMAPTPLAELERRIRESQFLVPKPEPVLVSNAHTAKSVLSPKKVKHKPVYAFNALEDLARIKTLVNVADEPKQASVTVAKQTKPTKKQEPAQVLEPTENLAKSVTDDDAMVFRRLNREHKEIDVAIDECVLVKRGVTMLGTHIPAIVWKKVFADLGLQVVAKQYIVAVYAPVIASPAEADGEVLDPEVIMNQATQLLSLHNRKQSDPCKMLEIVGEPFQLRNSSHWWYLTLPACVVNHTSFRFGSWAFTKTPRTRTAYAATVAA